MEWKEVKEKAKERMKDYCRVCPVCDGYACAGEVPGVGGTGSGSAFVENVEALASFKLNLSTLHDAKDPCTDFAFFGKELKAPIIAAPITGAKINMGGALTEEEYVSAVIQGSQEAGLLGSSGDTGDPTIYDAGLQAIKEAQGQGIPFIKPRDQEEIIKRVNMAEEAGALAVGVDIDGAGLIIMKMLGQPVGPKTQAELKEITESTNLPFIVKGIMTPKEAEMAAEAGAKAIVVSNHGGRVLDYTPGGADVLTEIAEAVKGDVMVMADGGVRSGTDALKYLALGADCVLVGRPVMIAAVGGYHEGVKVLLEKMTGELKQAMILTGCSNLSDISARIIY